MITIKLAPYTQNECADLLQMLNYTMIHLINKCNTDGCNHCKQQHICADLINLEVFLSAELQNGFPHCRKNSKRKMSERVNPLSF